METTSEILVKKKRHEESQQKGGTTNTNGLSHACGGKLTRINETPIEAGRKPGSFYHLYECDNCGEMVVVGGK